MDMFKEVIRRSLGRSRVSKYSGYQDVVEFVSFFYSGKNGFYIGICKHLLYNDNFN